MTLTPTLICLALNVYFEARNQPVADQVAVAQTVLERVESPLYPNDLCSVVQQRSDHGGCAFTWHCGVRIEYDRKAWVNALLIADGVLHGSGHADFRATHYHANYVQPWWGPFVTPLGSYGGRHLYYQEGG